MYPENMLSFRKPFLFMAVVSQDFFIVLFVLLKICIYRVYDFCKSVYLCNLLFCSIGATAAANSGEAGSVAKSAGHKVRASAIAMQLFREKGILGLYKGVGATWLRDITFSAIYFPLFAHCNALVGNSDKLYNTDKLLCLFIIFSFLNQYARQNISIQ